MQISIEKHAGGYCLIYPSGGAVSEGLPHNRGTLYLNKAEAKRRRDALEAIGATLEAAGYTSESAGHIVYSALSNPRHQVASLAAYYLQKSEKAAEVQKLAAAILEVHPGGAVSMTREELEKEALFTVSAALYYDLADNIEITSDEELRQIIAADGDEEKEEAIAS